MFHYCIFHHSVPAMLAKQCREFLWSQFATPICHAMTTPSPHLFMYYPEIRVRNVFKRIKHKTGTYRCVHNHLCLSMTGHVNAKLYICLWFFFHEPLKYAVCFLGSSSVMEVQIEQNCYFTVMCFVYCLHVCKCMIRYKGKSIYVSTFYFFAHMQREKFILPW